MLICAECGNHYTLLDSTRGYYACSGHRNRGSAICANTKKVRRDRLEAALLDALFNELFTPEAVAYLTRQIDAAITSALPDLPDQQARLEHDLYQARTELENVLTAIRQGFLTPATKDLLDRCERRVAECDAALRAHAQEPPPTVTSLPTVVARYLSDLRATLNTDVEAARALLARLVGSVILRRRGSQLLAEIEGKIDTLVVDALGGDIRGAGRGISSLAYWPTTTGAVA